MIKALLVALFFVAGMVPFAVELQDEEEILSSESFLISTCEERAEKFTQSPSLFNVLDTNLTTDTIDSKELEDLGDFAAEYLFEDDMPERLIQHVAFVDVEERAGINNYQCMFIDNEDGLLLIHQVASIMGANGNYDYNSIREYAPTDRLISTYDIRFSHKVEYLFQQYL